MINRCDASAILKLIESVDSDDVGTLDGIDSKVWCWVMSIDKDTTTEPTFSDSDITIERKIRGLPKYTRSRDALKSIRPKGYTYLCGRVRIGQNYWAILKKEKEDIDPVNSPYNLPTEELAELHAVIQAIEYERNSKGDDNQ